MSRDPSDDRRSHLRRAFERDSSRYARREKGSRTFWRELRVLGMVGWPIALFSAGGALLGRVLDTRFGTGVQFTLMLLTAGAIIGSYAAWRALQGGR